MVSNYFGTGYRKGDLYRPQMAISNRRRAVRLVFTVLHKFNGGADKLLGSLANARRDIHVKPAVCAGSEVFTMKLAGWSAQNEACGLPTSSGMILVFDAKSCRSLATLQGDHFISDLRTAAAGALSARELANKDVRTVGLLGTGEQAHRQIRGIATGTKHPRHSYNLLSNSDIPDWVLATLHVYPDTSLTHLCRQTPCFPLYYFLDLSL